MCPLHSEARAPTVVTLSFKVLQVEPFTVTWECHTGLEIRSSCSVLGFVPFIEVLMPMRQNGHSLRMEEGHRMPGDHGPESSLYPDDGRGCEWINGAVQVLVVAT